MNGPEHPVLRPDPPQPPPTPLRMGDPSTPPKAKRVFIVACRRSGTTWATMLLSQHPRVVGIQQSSFFHRVDYLGDYLGEEVKYGRHIITAADSASAESAELRRRPIRNVMPLSRYHHYIRPFAEEVYDRLAECGEDTLAVIDHQPENAHSWKNIIEIFPDAYFLHVVRDPRSVYSSYAHSARTWSNHKTFTSNASDFAAEWRTEVSSAREIPLRTDRYLEVRYEDMLANGPEELRRIHEYLELPSSEQQCREAIAACSLDRLRKSGHGPRGFFRKGQASGWRSEVPRSKVEVIEFDCASLMSELGYDRAFVTGPQKPFSMRVRDFLKRPLWALRRRLSRLRSA